MLSPSMAALAAAVLLLPASSGAAGEEPPLKPRALVRVHAGQVREIPGVVKLGPSVEMYGGEVVANTDRLVAVRVPGHEEPVCLPRPGATLTGRLIATDAEHWTIAVDGQRTPFKIPRYSIDAVDVGRGHQRGKAALLGAGLGLAIGGALGVAAGAGCGNSFGCPGPGGGAVVLGIPGAALGALLGALEAAEHWERVPLDHVRLSLSPHFGRSAGASLALSVRVGARRTP